MNSGLTVCSSPKRSRNSSIKKAHPLQWVGFVCLSNEGDPALCRLHHFDDALGLDDHLALVEQVEALDEQLVAAALDVEHAEVPAGAVGVGRAVGGHQLALAGIRRNLVPRRVVQRLA